MIIGFSTGCLYKSHDRLSPSTIKLFRKAGCNAIEVMFYSTSNTSKFLKLKKSDFEGFEYISVHAPIYRNGEKDKYLKALGAICEIHSKIDFDTVVLHPDSFDDFGIFKSFNLPFAVENMDKHKNSCKDAKDLKRVFEKFDVPMVFDINHCLSNDSSLKLAGDLLRTFHSRIKEIHLSGLDTFHDPLFKTKQEMIMDAIPDIGCPVIIESGLDGVEEISLELEYIKRYLSSHIKK